MKATCPYCGSTFEHKRRPDGTGTAPDGSDITEREEWLLRFLKDYARPGDIRSIQTAIFAKDTTGGWSWNYHLIQATLSRLVGRQLVRMEKTGKGFSYEALEPLAPSRSQESGKESEQIQSDAQSPIR